MSKITESQITVIPLHVRGISQHVELKDGDAGNDQSI